MMEPISKMKANDKQESNAEGPHGNVESPADKLRACVWTKANPEEETTVSGFKNRHGQKLYETQTQARDVPGTDITTEFMGKSGRRYQVFENPSREGQPPRLSVHSGSGDKDRLEPVTSKAEAKLAMEEYRKIDSDLLRLKPCQASPNDDRHDEQEANQVKLSKSESQRLHNESEQIGKLLSENKTREAVNMISHEAMQLDGSVRQDFLRDTYYACQRQHTESGGVMELGDWNTKTKAFERVEIDSNPNSEIVDFYRIAQPGDTLFKYAHEPHLQGPTDSRKYAKFLAEVNGLKNPNHLPAGYAIRTGLFYD